MTSRAHPCIGGPLHGCWIHADDSYSQVVYDPDPHQCDEQPHIGGTYRRLSVGYAAGHHVTVFVHSDTTDDEALQSINVIGKPDPSVH